MWITSGAYTLGMGKGASRLQAVSAIIYIALLGLAAHLVGEALPRRWFRFDRGLYRCRAWERGGAVYERFSIHRWKLLLPDKSRHARGMVKKQLGGMPTAQQLERLLQETCVAECVHWALMPFGAALMLLLPGAAGALAALLYALSHVPFILIQRYTRPRLARLYRRVSGGGADAGVPHRPAAAQSVGAA